jgi:hypothetical protein
MRLNDGEMGRIDAIIRDDLDADFRMEVSRSLGMRKGNLTVALEEAIKQWIEERRVKRKLAAERAWKTRRRGTETGVERHE